MAIPSWAGLGRAEKRDCGVRQGSTNLDLVQDFLPELACSRLILGSLNDYLNVGARQDEPELGIAASQGLCQRSHLLPALPLGCVPGEMRQT
jgi:hypothetical protein